MNNFEKACSEIDGAYTGEMTQENVVEWLKGAKIATLTLANGTKHKTQVLKLSEKHPDDVTICHRNKDGSIVAHIPVSFINIRAPKRIELSEEEREKRAERMNALRAHKNVSQ